MIATFFISFELMDSHLLYVVSHRLKEMVNWNEWICCGVGVDMKDHLIDKAINE